MAFVVLQQVSWLILLEKLFKIHEGLNVNVWIAHFLKLQQHKILGLNKIL